MDALTPAALVHFYDTQAHRIACGVSGLDHRSTKHPRQVTCEACVALLGERPFHAQAADPSAGAAP
ncbi:MAG TPA: hypothetical protein VF841_12810 [Anaeromyxobacter sp.]